ncbi:MAG: tRNA pseudouridine(38-40) synthase TruA [Planctomycetota bacterium]|jgi:tRNA pseudouridine38-40 synthase
MTQRRIKLVLHYDGSAYHGWQFQPDVDTVQRQGVHASGQVVHLDIDTPVPTCNFVRSLNHYLPNDIVVVSAEDVDKRFDAISSTQSKRYRYSIYTARLRDVRAIRYCWHRPGTLDVAAMQIAAAKLLGTQDFKSFASAADQRESSVRTILKCNVIEDGPWIHVDVQADGFLYNMVRNIVGTLVDIGRGRWNADYMEKIIAAKDRTAAGKIAPAKGLTLVEIFY